MTPLLKKILQIIIALILQAIDLFDCQDNNKVAKVIKSKIHLVEDPKDLSV